MSLAMIVCFLIFAIGCLIYFDIKPVELISGVINRVSKNDQSLRYKIKFVTTLKEIKKDRGLKKLFEESRKILTISGRAEQFPIVCTASVLAMVLGIMIAALLGNYFLMPVLVVGLGITPFWVVRILSYTFQKELNAELETGLSIITTAYLRQDNFSIAVKENIGYLKTPVLEVFRDFLFEIENVDPDIIKALLRMKRKIQNNTWEEWVEAVILCQRNKNLRTTLPPIINKFSDVRIVDEELSVALFDPLKELMMMSCMLLGVIPFLFFINKEWFDILMWTIPGKLIFALDVLIIFISFKAGVKHSKPAEFKR